MSKELWVFGLASLEIGSRCFMPIHPLPLTKEGMRMDGFWTCNYKCRKTLHAFCWPSDPTR